MIKAVFTASLRHANRSRAPVSDLAPKVCRAFRNMVPARGKFSFLFIALMLLLITTPRSPAQDKTIVSRLERAAALIGENRIEEAERQLSDILKAAPNEATTINLLGTVRAKQGRLDEAEALFLRAVRIDNQFLGAHMNLAYLYLLKNLPDKTVLELKEVHRLDPKNSDVSHKLARLLFSLGRLDECISFIEKMQEQNPLTVSLLVVLGDAYLKKGDWAKAEESYGLAINRESVNADALLGLALVSQARGDSKNVNLYLDRARSLITDSPERLYGFARVAMGAGLNNDAMLALKRAIELKPDEPRYYFAFGLTWLGKPDLQEAEQAFRRFVSYRPGDSQGQLYLGYVLLKQKKSAEAREWLEKSIQKETGTPETYYYLGLIAQEQNEDERAITLFEKAIALAPTFANAHIALGSTYLKLKNYERALRGLEAGVKLKPDDSKAHYNLAMLYARLKDNRRAQEEMRIVERLKSAGKAEDKESEILAPSNTSPR